MLLEDFDHRVETSKCDASATRLCAVAEFDADISCVFPYLNSRFQQCAYNPEARTVRLKSGGKTYAIHSHKIVTGIGDVSEAHPTISHIRDVINETWQRRAEITPREESRERVSVLKVYQLLPQTNCGACPAKTCMAFAVKLSSGDARLEECPELGPSAQQQLEQIFG
jgi:ArsR family metal-binding transcriptional regulator